MDWSYRNALFTALLIVGAAIHGAHGAAMISGTVFCDQCRDGQVSLFDYPLYGIKVSMACPGQDGHLTMRSEETTNWLGNYVMRFDGTPDMSGCRAQVSGIGQQRAAGCGAAAGPARELRLVFRMFDMEIYTVDPLISQPAQPSAFCPRSASPVPVPTPVTPALPPSVKPPPMPQLPPLPQLPPMPPMPSLPFLEASACPHQMWTMPEHQCYWRVLAPDMKVAIVFGPWAANRYGMNITLWESMGGRGDPYRTLLREGTTALLNSYNSLQFPYHPLEVVHRMNWALAGSSSTRQVLITAWRFMRANSGNKGNISCKFTPCK